MAVQTQMQVRRGTAASWTSTNPTLAAGEWGLETDTGKYKIGNGSTAWASLAYASNSVAAGTGISVSTSSGSTTVTNTVATTFDAKGDLVVGTGADTFAKLTAGTNEHRLVADSAQATGLKYVADTTNYAIAAKGDLLVGTAADTVAPLTVGTDGFFLTADSTQTTGLKWTTIASGSSSNGGMFFIASGSAATAKTFTVSLPTGGVGVDTVNSNSGLIALNLNFGTSTYSTFSNTGNFQATSSNLPKIGFSNAASVTSITVDVSPSGLWTTRSFSGFGTSIVSASITFGNSVFVAGLQNNVSFAKAIVSSTDGITWTSRTSSFGVSQSLGPVVAFGNGIFIAATANTSQGGGALSTSTDGTTWTTRAIFGTSVQTSFGQPLYISGLTTPWLIPPLDTQVNTLFVRQGVVSTDGITWTTRNFGISNTGAINSYVSGSNNFSTVKILQTLKNVTHYCTSTDGVTWTSRAALWSNSNPGWIGPDIATDGSKYVVVRDRTLYSSTDGITWTITSVPSNYFGTSTGGSTALYYNDSATHKWIAHSQVGNEHTLISSTDAINWSKKSGFGITSGTTIAFTGTLLQESTRYYQEFAYGNGVFIVKPNSNIAGQTYTLADAVGGGAGITSGDITGFITSYGVYSILS